MKQKTNTSFAPILKLIKINDLIGKENILNLKTMPDFLIVSKLNDAELFAMQPHEEYFSILTTPGARKTIRIKRKQFPLTPAFALTSYYAQGTTIKKFIIGLKPSKKKNLHIYICSIIKGSNS